MNILVTGCNGQLGNEIREYRRTKLPINEVLKHKFIFTDINIDKEVNTATERFAELDITNLNAIKELVKAENINLIINCAAYTNVDKAEEETIIAYTVNAVAVKNLVEAAKENNAKLIHISTDYVFDGTAYKPYDENKIVNPIGIYGATKEAGERIAQEQLNEDAIIIRTAWLYSNFGKNFVRTMVGLGQTKEEIKVIFDQIGTPTYAEDLAAAILKIALECKWVGGIYHYTNEGVCSWYDFAKEIMDAYGLNCKVLPIHTDEYPTKAERPHYSVLDKTKIKETFDIEIPHWKDALKECAKHKFV